ncbi:transglycosylase domain-containing protein [Nonomuraea antimicrobica]
MVGVVVLSAGLFGMIMVAYANTAIPTEAQAEALAQQSTIYYRDGKTKIADLGFKRESVPITAMAQVVKDAAVAIENDTFYEDSGISIPGMFRSVWMTVSGEQLQGASTITQQMARNYYDGLSQEVSIKRKVMEIFVAVKLDDELTKDQILQNYLNTVNFGRAYGVQTAAKAYFGSKATAANLTPEQGAYLAARIQRPNWEPDDPALQSRFKTVIDYMAKQWPDKYGNLPQTAKFPKTLKNPPNTDLSGIKGYMVEQVLQELEQRNLSRDEVKSGGYKITSTFDKKLMKDAQTAVKSTMKEFGMSTEFHGGLAAVDAQHGRVLAFYGGDDYLTDPWNEPFQSTKQAASAFKPYVLAAWLQAGYSLKSFVPGNQTVPKELPGQQPGGIKNSHNVGAAVDVVKATAESVNTAFVSMAFALPNQLEDVQKLVEDAGFNPKRMKDDIDEHHYQFAIGSALVTPVEQAAGYAIFANGGKYTRYHVIREVKQNNKLVYGEQATSSRSSTPTSPPTRRSPCRRCSRAARQRARAWATGRPPARPGRTTTRRKPGSSATRRRSPRRSGSTVSSAGPSRARSCRRSTPTAPTSARAATSTARTTRTRSPRRSPWASRARARPRSPGSGSCSSRTRSCRSSSSPTGPRSGSRRTSCRARRPRRRPRRRPTTIRSVPTTRSPTRTRTA